jgi:hypothetical protein
MRFCRWLMLFSVGLCGCSNDAAEIKLVVLESPSLPGVAVSDVSGNEPEIEPIDLTGVTLVEVGAHMDWWNAGLMGVVSGPTVYNSAAPNLALHLKNIGMRAVRNTDYYDDRMDMERLFRCADKKTYPSWECDAKNDKNFHWDSSDGLFNTWINEGFEPMFRLGGSAVSDVDVHDFKGPQNKKQENNWIAASKVVVNRYLNWKGEGERFEWLNIWTEFPNEDYWDRSEKDFSAFWAKAFSALKKEFGALRIGGPGFSEKVTRSVMVGAGGPAVKWLEHLYKKGVRPDWIGWHLYSNRAHDFILAADRYAELLAGEGQFDEVPWAGSGFFDGTVQVVAAWGTTPMALNFNGEWELMTLPQIDRIYNRKEGAALLTSAWIAMQHSPVERAFYNRFGDRNSDPTLDPEGSNTLLSMMGSKGLFYGDAAGTYKRSAHAVRLWARMVDEFYERLNGEPSVIVEGPVNDARLWTLAGQSSAGRKAVLVSNSNKFPVRWMVRFGESGAMANHFSEVAVFQLDGANDGMVPFMYAGQAFEIQGGTVQLVVLTP